MLQLQAQGPLEIAASPQSLTPLVRRQVALAPFTSFRVGGAAEWYAEPCTFEELTLCVQWAQAEGLPLTVLGSGSNLLISDAGLQGLVLSTRFLRKSIFEDEAGQATVAAGTPLPALSRRLARRGWQGMEWAVGIPGTLGGAVVMNAGAHGGSMAGRVLKVKVLGPEGIEVWTPELLQYSYRTSALQESPYVVLDATLQLLPGADPKQVMDETTQALRMRKSSQPYDRPSCGSVFRNPTPHSAGWLIEQSGLKGFQIGKAQIAHRHANFILNCGGAQAQEIFDLIRHIQAEISSRWSLALHPEVKMIGEFQN